MASRRMLGISQMKSNSVLNLSDKAFRLYTYLTLDADDDGMVDGALSSQLHAQASDEHLDELVKAGLVIRMEDDVYVVVHWNQFNKVDKSKYTPSLCQDALRKLWITNDKKYVLMENADCTNGCAAIEYRASSSKKNKDTDNNSNNKTPTNSKTEDDAEVICCGEDGEIWLTQQQIEYLEERYPDSWRGAAAVVEVNKARNGNVNHDKDYQMIIEHLNVMGIKEKDIEEEKER